MPYVHRTTAWRHVRPWLTAGAIVGLMLVALAGPAAAQAGPATLLDASVSPRVAGPSTPIHFAVMYHAPDGRAAAEVHVLVDGHARTMRLAALGENGLWYTLTTALPAGHHWVRFEATRQGGGGTALDAGNVWVRAAAGLADGGDKPPNPTPKPQATPGGHTPGRPGAGTSGAGDPDGTGGQPHPTQAPGGGSSAGGSAAGEGASRHDPTATTPTTTTTATDGPAAAADPGPAEPTATDPAAPDPGLAAVGPSAIDPDPTPAIGAVFGPAGSSGGGGDGGPGGPASPDGLGVIGVGGPFDRFFRVYPVLFTSGGTAVVWAAFVIFGKRRRDGEPPAPDAVLAAHAATALEPIPTAGLVPPQPRNLPPGVQPDEADLPRWRRPSLLQARKTDPLRSASVAVSLSFDGVAAGSLGLVDGGERRQIRYRLVRLLDLPDEAAGRELGVLDAGDEVQIVEAYGIYRLVACPDGQRGWLHKMVLGDLLDDDPTAEPAPDGIDEDVLAAFLAARSQTA